MRDFVSNFVRFLASMLVQCEKACELSCEEPCEELCEEPCEELCEESCEEPYEEPCETNNLTRFSQDSQRTAWRAHKIFTENLNGFSTDSHRILTGFSELLGLLTSVLTENLTAFSQYARPLHRYSHREPHRILTEKLIYPLSSRSKAIISQM